MTKFFRRIMAIALATVMCFSLAPIDTYAANVQAENESFIITDIGHGSYCVVENDAAKSKSSFSSSTGSLTAALYDRESDIYKIKENGTYIAQVDEGMFMQVDKIDFTLGNLSETKRIIAENNISGRLATDILNASQKAADSGKSVAATLYTPNANTRDTTYYTYNNIQMRQDIFTITNDNFGYNYISQGVSAFNIAKSITEILISEAGGVYRAVGLGYTLFSFFSDNFGVTVVQGAGSDFIQADIYYNGVIRYVYANIGEEWYLGYQGESVTINRISINQKYVIDGVPQQDTSNLPSSSYPQSVTGPHYSTYNQTAINNYANTLQEFSAYKFRNLVFDFRFI